MEQYDFKLIPVPVEALEAVGLVAGAMAEAFVDGSRLIIQKAQGDAVCETYNEDCEDCEGCPYCCPCCGECLKEQIDGGDQL